MKIIFLAYRDWALEVVEEVRAKNFNVHTFEILTSPAALTEYSRKKNIDLNLIFMAVGWSWIIEPEITNRYLCLGLHPSDLPNYRGGSPIQNQIIDGVISTKCSLFRITEKLDSGEIWGKSELWLGGDSMDEVLKNVKSSSVKLIESYLNNIENIQPESQDLSVGSYKRRRKPEESRILPEEVSFSDISKLYNKIRCLTYPYPNAYIEDSMGNRLYFEKVRFSKGGDIQ
jgi:methionyl-tRNA formyltransferase